MKRFAILSVLLLAVIGLTLASAQPARAKANPNPGIVPNQGQRYGQLGAQWWQWALSFPKAQVPYLLDGSVDISAHQSGNVWFLAGAGGDLGGTEVVREGEVPAGKYLFTPIANYINDYPCPDPLFKPEHGESLKAFLTRTAWIPSDADLSAAIDGNAVAQIGDYYSVSNLFWFTADPEMAEHDACITGEPERGLTVGYSLLLRPLAPGNHTVHFESPSWGQNITYNLTVAP
jgi:hypothetical protein